MEAVLLGIMGARLIFRGRFRSTKMEVSFTIEVRIPNIEIESIIFDERGNADVTISADGVQEKCSLDATGSDHGTIMRALLSLAGVHINTKREVISKCPSTSWQARRTSVTM